MDFRCFLLRSEAPGFPAADLQISAVESPFCSPRHHVQSKRSMPGALCQIDLYVSKTRNAADCTDFAERTQQQQDEGQIDCVTGRTPDRYKSP
jgi:hypothetical protein